MISKHLLITILALCILGCKSQNKETKTEEPAITDEQLSESPRHHEWVDLKRADSTICKAFVAYPESDGATQAVIVIHENRGLNDWARSFADELASKGYLVIAPDLISNTVDGIEKTTDFENSDQAREAIYALDPDMVTADLDAAYAYLKNDPSSNGIISVAGFCWGGSQTFRYAINNPDIKSAYVFYGTAPKGPEGYADITASVYGFYGGNDNRVNATLSRTDSLMQANNKAFDHIIYEGATHAFMRKGSQADPSEADKTAHDQAWERLLSLLERD